MSEYIKCLKKVYVAVAISLILLLSVTSPATAAVEKSVTAQVTVSTRINFTIIDYGSAGLKFGNLIPGSKNNPEVSQGETGAVLLQLGADSNIGCLISTKATDFISGSDKLSVKNVSWSTENDTTLELLMKDSYTLIKTLQPGESQGLWHWLDVPATQAPGIYSAGFYYQAAKVT